MRDLRAGIAAGRFHVARVPGSRCARRERRRPDRGDARRAARRAGQARRLRAPPRALLLQLRARSRRGRRDRPQADARGDQTPRRTRHDRHRRPGPHRIDRARPLLGTGELNLATERKSPASAGPFPFNRGARIRTGDLTDPNGARYQAAPRPDEAPVSHKGRPSRSLRLPPAPRGSARPLSSPRAAALRSARRGRPPARARALRGLLRQRPAGAGSRARRRIATGVSAHAELFELAVGEQVQLLLVHHGLFWGPGASASTLSSSGA